MQLARRIALASPYALGTAHKYKYKSSPSRRFQVHRLREELRLEQKAKKEVARDLDAARRQLRVPPKGWRPEDVDALLHRRDASPDGGGPSSPDGAPGFVESDDAASLLRLELGVTQKRLLELLR
eukprot:2405911-Prymnesium_polylepis.1